MTRVPRRGAAVTLTHAWALRHGHASVDAWWESIAPQLKVTAAERWTGRAEGGTVVGLTATR